jgi:hypothetical protein
MVEDGVQRGHLLVRKVVLKCLLIDYVEELGLVFDQLSDIFNIQKGQIFLLNALDVRNLIDFELKV